MSTVLLHGFTGSSRSWGDPIVDALASAVGAPVLLDLPGHGRHAGSVAPWRYTLEGMDATVDSAAGPDPVDLVGYSMGGRVALAYAVRNPQRVRRLVLESASPGLATGEEQAARREQDAALAQRIERDGVQSFVDGWEALPLFESHGALPPEVLARQRAIRLQNDPRSLAASLKGLGTGALPSFWGSLPGLRVPVLVLVGGLDRKFVGIGRQMASALPHARLVEVADAGHTVHLERPDAWLAAVTGFLTERAPS